MLAFIFKSITSGPVKCNEMPLISHLAFPFSKCYTKPVKGREIMDWIKLAAWVSLHPILSTAIMMILLASVSGILYAILRVIPHQTLPILLLNLFIHFSTYLAAKILPISYTFHDLTSVLDQKTPFFAPMILVYLLAYLQWGLYWIFISKQSSHLRSRFLSAEWISKAICAVIFIVYPTTLVRPDLSGKDVFEQLTGLIYILDSPSNLLPSIHCLQSWFCLRAVLQFERVPKWLKITNLIFSLLVFCSTVFVKQHVWIDFPTAVLAAEIGLWLGRKTNLDAVIRSWEDKLSHSK